MGTSIQYLTFFFSVGSMENIGLGTTKTPEHDYAAHMPFREEPAARRYKFSCEYCGKFSSFKCKLKRHSTLYTGIKPFVCPLCKKSFTRGDNLTTHLAKCH